MIYFMFDKRHVLHPEVTYVYPVSVIRIEPVANTYGLYVPQSKSVYGENSKVVLFKPTSFVENTMNTVDEVNSDMILMKYFDLHTLGKPSQVGIDSYDYPFVDSGTFTDIITVPFQGARIDLCRYRKRKAGDTGPLLCDNHYGLINPLDSLLLADALWFERKQRGEPVWTRGDVIVPVVKKGDGDSTCIRIPYRELYNKYHKGNYIITIPNPGCHEVKVRNYTVEVMNC